MLLSAALAFGGLGLTAAAEDAIDVSSENLLSDPGFENELLGAGEWKFPNTGGWYNETNGGISERTEGQRHSGEYSAMLQQATFGQRVSLEAGKSYRLTAYVKADQATNSPVLGLYDGSEDYPADAGNGVQTQSISATSEWQEVTVDFNCSASQDYVVCLMTWEDNINVYFDDITLCEIELPFDGGGVVNGDFADESAWTIDGAGAIADGVFAVSGTSYETRLSQTVDGLENGVYDVSAYVTSTDINGTAYLYAKTEGHTMASTALPVTDTAMRITVPGVIVDNGKCDIGLYASGASSITLDNVSLAESDGTRVSFLKGGEISKLTYVEDQGGVFRYADGTEGDALQIMAENGFNLARIRLLDDPGKGHGDGTYYLPEYYMTEEDCLDLARRAKDKGMQICFTFAYSDYWVDADKQMVPCAWQQEITAQGLTGEALVSYLENRVYGYTKDVMLKLIEQGTQPEFVSVGNEIQVGMLFNRNSDNNGLYNNSSYLARLLSAGAQAVRDVSPESKIIFHSDNGGNLYRRGTFISALRTVDESLYDVIGVSYYPFWTSKTAHPSNVPLSIDDVVSDFAKIIAEFDKDVIIMETGYNWAEKRGDGYEGQLQDSGYYQDIYGESQEGQRAFLTELYAKLKQVAGGRCIGDMYWDPVMIDADEFYKVGWAKRESDDYTEGNVVSNSTIFDFEGRAVAGQQAMRYNTNSADNINITGTVSDGESIAAEKEITFSVNGKKYNVTTDKFGKYIVSVPYPADGKLEISAKGSEQNHSTNAPYDGVLVSGIDFTDLDTQTEPDESGLTLEVSPSADAISYETSVIGEYNGTLYVALYGSDMELKAVRLNEGSGSFEDLEPDEYTIKTFLWGSTLHPRVESRSETAAVGTAVSE